MYSVAEKDGRWFHIRPDGSPSYEARFELVGHFPEGLAQAMNDGQWFHIRHDGSRADCRRLRPQQPALSLRRWGGSTLGCLQYSTAWPFGRPTVCASSGGHCRHVAPGCA